MFRKLKPYSIISLMILTILITIAVIFKFIPFGENTMLTIDLGQQYIDFYSLFRHTFTEEPGNLLYSFQKAIGGEMIGLWAYYLLSPFNIILLFFDESNFDLAVTALTFLKFIAAGNTFLYLIRHKYELTGLASYIFTLTYVFMGYSIVYMLNIMWLDGLVLLPLIVLGLHYLIIKKNYSLYVFSLAIMLIANYYIGYMICLFLSFYAIFAIVEALPNTNLVFKSLAYLRFVVLSILGTAMSGIVLIPTFYSLTGSKGVFNNFDWTGTSDHGIIGIVSKFFVGAFEFDEIKASAPPIYIGMLLLVLIVGYFFSKKIRWQEKLSALFVLSIFYLSIHFDFINKLWHGGKFPIWYHYRFTFVMSFFLITLGIRFFMRQPKSYRTIPLLMMMIGFTSGAGYYLWTNPFSYLPPQNILISIALILAFIILLQMTHVKATIRYTFILLLVIIDILGNTVLTLDDFNYVRADKFDDYTTILSEAVDPLEHGDSDFYRIHKTFMRTKNEAMYSHYSGMDHFGSTIESSLPELYGYLGLPDGSGFVAYTNGTLFLDDFFGIKYLIDVTEDTDLYTDDSQYLLYPEALDLDMNYYVTKSTYPRYKVYENADYFGLALEVNSSIVNESFYNHQPIYNQNLLLSLIDFDGTGEDYFIEQPIDSIDYKNVEILDIEGGNYYTYKNQVFNQSNMDATITYRYHTATDNPYYFSLPSQLSKNNAYLRWNGERYRFYSPFRHRQITNAGFRNEGMNHTFEIDLLEDELKSNELYLYEFDLSRYERMISDKVDHRFQVESFSPTYIEGSITTTQTSGHLLFTIPYDKNWHISVDGHEIKPIPVLNETLMAIPINQGQHQVTLAYRPKSVLYGLMSSILAFGLFLFLNKFAKSYRKVEN